MAEAKCRSCGKDLPSELGQHTTAPLSGLANCPHCGAEVHVPKAEATDAPGAVAASGGRDKPSSPGFHPPTPPDTSEEGAAPDASEGHNESFVGHESVEGVMQEVREKQEGS